MSNFHIGLAETRQQMDRNGSAMPLERIKVRGHAALCAVEPFRNRDGRIDYKVLELKRVAPDDLAQEERELRRDLVRMAEEKPQAYQSSSLILMGDGTPTTPHAAACNSADWRENVTRRKSAEAEAAKSEIERLDKIGAGFVAKSSGDVDLAVVKKLLDEDRILAYKNARPTIMGIRQAFDDNLLQGAETFALARALMAAGAR